MSKGFWAIIAIIVVILGGVFFATSRNDKSGSSNASTALASNHVEGTSPTNVKLVEYGDYQCPFCTQFYPIVKQVTEEYKDKVQFQFVNLPLTSIHKNAFAAARASEAASLQGKFWEMHDQLYSNSDPQGQKGWVVSDDPLNDYFVSFANTAGVTDINKFKTDFASSAVNNTINADIAAFNKTGEEMSTPTFFLDGKKISPSYNAADFRKALDTELKNKGASS